MLSPDPRAPPASGSATGASRLCLLFLLEVQTRTRWPKREVAWPVHQRACGRQVYSWRTSGVQVTLSEQVTNTSGVSTVSHTPPRSAVN